MKDAKVRSALAIMFALAVAGAAWAQLPGVSKITKKISGKTDSSDAKGPKGPVPEITSVSPDNAPPQGSGELVLTGKNLVEGMGIRISCKDGISPHIDSMKVESAVRAVAHVTFPDDTFDGPCEVYVDYVLGGNNEILPTREGTPEVVQMKGVSFNVSGTSNTLPVAFGEYGLVPEDELKARDAMGSKAVVMQKMAEDIKNGKVNPMDPDFIKKMQEASMAMSKSIQQGGIAKQQRTKGTLLLNSGSLSFVADGKTVFTEPVSKVKEVAEVNDPMGSGEKIFKIAFSDGKTYGFEHEKSGTVDVTRIKKKLGK